VEKRSLKREILGSWILYQRGYNGFYDIFVYMMGVGWRSMFWCRYGACHRNNRAPSMDRNYYGPVSLALRARYASVSIAW